VLNDMGTGKTLSAVWAADILLEAQKIRRVLVVGPLSTMKSVWGNELYLNVPHRKFAILHGTRQQRLERLHSGAEFFIINHDGIKSIEDELIAFGFDVLIIDELTAFKSHSSDRSKTMKRIADTCRAVWGMTGDLTPNSPLEAYMPVKIVNPASHYLPRYFGVYRDACMIQVNEQYWVPKPEAPQIVSMCVQPAIRYTREQCLDLPDTTYQVLEIPMTAEQRKFYDAMKKQALIDTENGTITAANAAVVLNKLLQISAGAVKNDDGGVVEIGCQDRMEALLQLYDETPQKKLVIFATYRATIDMLVREFTKHKISVAKIDGDVPQNLRASHIDRFQRGDLSVLVLQPQSSAHGITLTASSTVVWFSLVPSNELFQQGNARIVRAGQNLKTFIYLMVGSKAEKHVARILQRKDNLSREILDLFRAGDL
jgi:SNF2 family DNA or RNA helicase